MTAPELEQAIAEAAWQIASANYVVALVGAGLSAESGVPTFRGEGGLWTKYGEPDMRGRVPLRVPVVVILRHGLVQPGQHVHAHGRVRVLVDDDAGGSMRNVDVADALGDICLAQGGVDAIGDLLELLAGAGRDANTLDQGDIPPRGHYSGARRERQGLPIDFLWAACSNDARPSPSVDAGLTKREGP